MKILLFADLHMCPRASIVNKWGINYPARLENCVGSVNWLERKAEELGCDFIVNLGDFFDKPDLSSETITASKDIQWSNITHYSLVGNHDASTSSLIFNAANSFIADNHHIITEPRVLSTENCDILFLPYIVECDRKPIDQYFTNSVTSKSKIILSHNDISGIQLGPIMSKTGFTVDEIESSCDMFINGHLHNGQAITHKIINLGNLTGKDFGEDSFKYSHNIAILDTDTLQLTFIENPYAYNFYKIQIENEDDISILDTLKQQAIVSIKCNVDLIDIVKHKVNELSSKIIESRIIIVKKHDTTLENSDIDLTVDHLARFVECCKTNIEYSSILEEEISEVCK